MAQKRLSWPSQQMLDFGDMFFVPDSSFIKSLGTQLKKINTLQPLSPCSKSQSFFSGYNIRPLHGFVAGGLFLFDKGLSSKYLIFLFLFLIYHNNPKKCLELKARETSP